MDFRNLSLQECQHFLSPRPKDAHKGDFGHVLIVGGDYGMGGAVRLAGEAALRSGAGLVSVATRPEHAFAISGACPELMCKGVAESKDLDRLLTRATVVVVGPGLGRNDWGRTLYERVLATNLPVIVDADGLNQLAEEPIARDNWILTPHPGEAARLLQETPTAIQKDRLKAIHLLQKRYQGIIVLKGANSLVLGQDDLPYLCKAGNPGMASAGMGDVLTGVIAALVAQELTLLKAACLGVCAHGFAGDLAAEKGERGIKAPDLLEFIRVCLNP